MITVDFVNVVFGLSIFGLGFLAGHTYEWHKNWSKELKKFELLKTGVK